MAQPPFGMTSFDPSKMDPKVMMQLAEVVRQLPPDKISHMQTLMHNMMAGYDVRKEMEEFESSLPPGFREKLAAIMGPSVASGSVVEPAHTSFDPPQGVHEARMVILRAVADGRMQPEDAEKLLFPE